MARTPISRPGRSTRPGAPTSPLLTRLLVVALLAAALPGLLTGCAGGVGRGEPLSPQADCARRGVPQPVPVPREFSKTLLPTYRLAPGDTVLVEPARFDTPLRFPADQPVQPDGTIDLGRFGRVAVAGMTVKEVEELVAVRIDRVAERDENLARAIADDPMGVEVNVRLIDPRGSVYYVLGAVQTPGVFQLAGRETVLDAILTAGGLLDGAKKCDIILSRPSIPGDCRTVLPVCYDHLVQMGDSTTNYQILPGDRIFVPAKGCKDTLGELFGADDGCDLCACHPQFGCGPDVKPCPTPVRYAAMCPDATGMSVMDFLGNPIEGFRELTAPPAPSPATGAEGAADGEPQPAPAPEPIDPTEVPEDAPADDNAADDNAAAEDVGAEPVAPPAVAPPVIDPPVAGDDGDAAPQTAPTAPEAGADDEADPDPLRIDGIPDDFAAAGRVTLPAAPAWDADVVPTLDAEGF